MAWDQAAAKKRVGEKRAIFKRVNEYLEEITRLAQLDPEAAHTRMEEMLLAVIEHVANRAKTTPDESLMRLCKRALKVKEVAWKW